MKKLNTYILLTSIVMFSLQEKILAMEPDTNNSSNIRVKAKKPVLMEPSFYDTVAVTLREDEPVCLINRIFTHFDNSSTIFTQKETNKITVIANDTEGCAYQLESKRYLVNAGDKIKLSCKINVHSGGPVYLGLLNTKRNGWYGGHVTLHKGSFNKTVTAIVPEGETETSFACYIHGTPGKPVHSSFTIERLGINKM